MAEPERTGSKVLVVCTGNICRSPMGERLIAHALAAEPAPLNELQVLSAGLAAYGGDPASSNAIKALGRVGLDLSDHRSRRMEPELLDDVVLVLGMTDSHHQMLLQMTRGGQPPVHLFRAFLDAAQPQVPDPYGADLPSYIETRDLLAEAVPSIVAHLRERMGVAE